MLLDGATVALAPGEGVDLDAQGWRVLPAACEPHAHLDKALTASRLPPGIGNDLVAACDSWRVLLPTIDRADTEARALAAVRRYVARGITAIRSHVDLHVGPDPFRAVDALTGLRERLRGRVTLQVCLLAGHETPTELVAAAADRGIDVMGGCPHLADDPRAECTRMLDIAEARDLPVDLHVDEVTDLPAVRRRARHRRARPPDPRARPDPPGHGEPRGAARHAPAVAAGSRARGRAARGPRRRHAADHQPLPAGPRRRLRRPARAHRGARAPRAGIPLAAGADNVRDPFNAAGRADPFETTSLLQTAGHLTAEQALHAVTTGARAVLGLPRAGVAPGDVADLLLVPDVDLGDVLAGAEDARIVLVRRPRRRRHPRPAQPGGLNDHPHDRRTATLRPGRRGQAASRPAPSR